MHISIFTDTYKPQVNGVVTHIEQTTKKFIERGHRVLIFAPGKKTFRIENRSKMLKIVKIPSFRFYAYKDYRISKPMLSKISKTFEKEKVDIIHVHTPFVLGLIGIAISKLYSIPIVGTYHTLLPEYFPHITKGRFYRVMKRIGNLPTERYTKFVYSKIDLTIAPSEEIKKLLESYDLKTICIPNGIDLNFFRKTKEKKEKIREKYKIPKDKKILLFVGRISFEKRIEILLEMCKYLEDEDVLLLIAGSGPSLKKYKEMKRKLKLKNVRFLGYVDDNFLPLLYKTADIFVSASDTETQGIVFLEAMACGLPIVAVNKGGAKDIVRDKRNGLLARSNDAVDFTIKVVKLLTNKSLRKKIRKNNLKDIKNFSIERTTDKILRVYESLINNKKEEKIPRLLKLISLYKDFKELLRHW